MSHSSEHSVTEKLLSVLYASSLPLSTRDLCVRLRFSHLRLPDHEIGSLLRDLLNEGKVNFLKGRWTAIPATGTILHRNPAVLPPLSKETLGILDWKSHGVPGSDPSADIPAIEPDSDSADARISSGRWDIFRRLVAYYRQCICHEEGADASAFQNELGKRFLYLRRLGWWHPRPGISWQTIVPLGPHLAPLLNALPGRNQDHALVVGYPVQAYYKEKEGEPSVAIIRPIFFFTVETAIAQDGLIVSCDEPRPEVNLGWLEFAFARNLDRQRSFLSACGFLNRGRPIDEPPGLERGERVPGLENLVAALSAFMPEKVREPLHMESVPDYPLSEPFSTGIYNRAVLMLARRTKYTATLLKELSAIEKAPDDVLDRTALRSIFATDRVPDSSEALLHEAIVADTGPLNAEQRLATASLLIRDVTVVTGPPGTGKSQVVSSTVANARLRDQTVLFASRNHKAIDAVIGRLSDPEGRALIVRTNSKDDPGLNYTFSNAIREMLDAPPRPELIERLKRFKEELTALLDERGRKAIVARRTTETAMALGELEERRSYVAQSLPEEMALFLDIRPERFPVRAVRKVVQAVHAFHGRSREDTLPGRLYARLRACLILPRYWLARHKLRCIPKVPALPAFPGPSSLSALVPELSLLEKALEYARLRIECLPFEATLSELPQMADTTAEVGSLSKRIEEVALRAMPLDLDGRCNLDDMINREQLDGLRAALNAMRTGLDEGGIRQETIRGS